MKRTLFFILILLSQLNVSFMYAQKKTKNLSDKEIAREQKRLETEGWKLWNSSGNLKEMLTNKYSMQDELMVVDGEKVNRYVISVAFAENRSLNTAMQLAETKAKSDIASKQKTLVDVTTVQTNKTKTVDKDIVESEDQTGTAIYKHSDAKMNKVENVFVIYKKTEKGMYEVEVCLALDMKQ